MGEGEADSSRVPDRVSTGNPGLDVMLHGGLVRQRPYLLVGPAGTGKTKLALQFLCEGARRGEKVLLVTVEDPPNEMLVNHRSMRPELDGVYVFDAIPDVMRYEHSPYRDISSVRKAVPFAEVPSTIRKTPELVSVEVTYSALEQMLKTEVPRRRYTRIVLDSLTALQYFGMKGIDETSGAQSFLRFLSDLGVTTLLTVEAPLEEIETAEELLARGEIRLFRWEHEGTTVRAVGVEKFRGSSHDIRIHPYRIGPGGIDINLDATISKDTRWVKLGAIEAALAAPTSSGVDGSDVSSLLASAADLRTLGVDTTELQAELDRLGVAAREHRTTDMAIHLVRARAMAAELSAAWEPRSLVGGSEAQMQAAHRIQRWATSGADILLGVPPTELPGARPAGAVPEARPMESSPETRSAPSLGEPARTVRAPPTAPFGGPELSPAAGAPRPPDAPREGVSGGRRASRRPPLPSRAPPRTVSPESPQPPSGAARASAAEPPAQGAVWPEGSAMLSPPPPDPQPRDSSAAEEPPSPVAPPEPTRPEPAPAVPAVPGEPASAVEPLAAVTSSPPPHEADAVAPPNRRKPRPRRRPNPKRTAPPVQSASAGSPPPQAAPPPAEGAPAPSNDPSTPSSGAEPSSNDPSPSTP